MNVKVTELDAAKICQDPQHWSDYIYYLITGEILLLVCKYLSLKYFVFTQHQKLCYLWTIYIREGYIFPYTYS